MDGFPRWRRRLQYLQRFAALSQLFDDDLRFEGIILSGKESQLVGAVPGGCSMVISQQWLVAARAGRSQRLRKKRSPLSWLNLRLRADPGLVLSAGYAGADGLLILDAKPDNFVKTVAGILPFDLMIG
jgi:hypothetical protein